MAVYSFALQINGSVREQKHSIFGSIVHTRKSLSSIIKPFWRELQQLPMKVDVSKTLQNTSQRILDVLVDSVFQFADQPLLPSQNNFAPVEEIGGTIEVSCSEGKIPVDFPEGVFIRNDAYGPSFVRKHYESCQQGTFTYKSRVFESLIESVLYNCPNPLFGGLKTISSILGKSSHTWVEGEGMLHAVYFMKSVHGDLTISYNNKYIESETFKLEKQKNKPSFLPALEGDSPVIMAAYLINWLRFNTFNKHLSNTNIFEHSGKYYSIAENYLPQEIDIFTLDTHCDWDVDGAWDRPCTSHPKKAPGTGELVIMGIDAKRPFYVVGVISADGKKLVHKVDLKFKRSVIAHEIGVTQKYNVIFDYPLTLNPIRLTKGGPLVKFIKEDYARIGVMPRYGDADSVQWFEVETCATNHIFNCFEDGNEVVVRGCSALEAVFPGPEFGKNKFEWFSRGFNFIEPTGESNDGSLPNGYLFHRAYESRLNRETGAVKKRYITGTEFSVEFPFISGDFTGLKHKCGYTQVIDSIASSSSGMAKYGGLAKLYFDKPHSGLSLVEEKCEQLVKAEYHKFEENNFCSGSVFVSKRGGVDEDDGWIVTFIHNEETNVTQVHIIDAKKFESEPVAKITLPQRVPYGFHGIFASITNQI